MTMNITKSIHEKCTSIKFGNIPAVRDCGFYGLLNDKIPALCRSLPLSAQAGAMMFLMEYFRIQVGEPLDFFKDYYPPAWSSIYWMKVAPHANESLSDNDLDTALCAQAMAMLLHSLDDHLVDGDIPVTHLTLLVKGQAWLRMNDCIERFCAEIPGGTGITRTLLDDYYSGITEKEAPLSLDRYCGLFRKQMATWTIMPVLIARKIASDEGFISDLRSAYESFGIAWRLLDDIQDLEADLAKGGHGAVYACLDCDGRALWDSLQHVSGPAADQTAENIFKKIRDASILETIARRMVSELDHAADLAKKIGLPGLAGEYRTLAGPVIKWLAAT
jgi:hypothetical protein